MIHNLPGKNGNYPEATLSINQTPALISKKLIPEFEKQIQVALGYFPELKHIRISFKYTRDAIFPYASRPNWKTMFRKKKNWEYLILISESCKSMDDVLLKKIPFE